MLHTVRARALTLARSLGAPEEFPTSLRITGVLIAGVQSPRVATGSNELGGGSGGRLSLCCFVRQRHRRGHPTAVLDYKGARRYLSAFWID
jgi:hypothetical protein